MPIIEKQNQAFVQLAHDNGYEGPDDIVQAKEFMRPILEDQKRQIIQLAYDNGYDGPEDDMGQIGQFLVPLLTDNQTASRAPYSDVPRIETHFGVHYNLTYTGPDYRSEDLEIAVAELNDVLNNSSLNIQINGVFVRDQLSRGEAQIFERRHYNAATGKSVQSYVLEISPDLADRPEMIINKLSGLDNAAEIISKREEIERARKDALLSSIDTGNDQGIPASIINKFKEILVDDSGSVNDQIVKNISIHKDDTTFNAIFSADQGVVDTDNKIIETAEAISQFSDYESTALTSGMFTNLGSNEKPIPNISELGVKMVDLSKQNYSVEKFLAQEYERVLNAMPTPGEYQTHLISLDDKSRLTHAALLDPAKTIVLPQGSEFITEHFNQYGNPDFVVGVDRSTNQLGMGVRVKNQLVKFIPKNEFSLNNGWNAILPEELKSRIALDNNTVEQTTIDKILGDKKAKRQKVSFLGSDQKAEVVWSPYKVQWHAVGSERFFFDNEEIEIPLMHANQFIPGQGKRLFANVHAHLDYDNEAWRENTILYALDQEIGRNNVLPLLTPADVDFFLGSLQRQNKASQRLYGKSLDSQKILAGVLGFTNSKNGKPLEYVGGKYLYLPKFVTNEKAVATVIQRTDEALADIRSSNPKVKPVVKYFQLMNRLMDDYIPREIIDSPKGDYMMASAKSIRLREEKKLRDEIRVSILERNRLQGVGIPDPYLFKYLTDLNNDIELANGLNQESLEGALDKLSSFNRKSGEITRGEFTSSSSFKGLGNNVPIIQVGRIPFMLNNNPVAGTMYNTDDRLSVKQIDNDIRINSPPQVETSVSSLDISNLSDFHPSIQENRDRAMLVANTYGVQRTADMLPQVIAKVSTPTKTYQTDLGSVIKAQAVAISRFRSSMSQADYKDDKAMLIKLRNDIAPENLLQSIETGRFYRIDTPGMEDFVIYVIGEIPKAAGYSLNEFSKKDVRGQAVAQLADNVFILDTSIQTESMKQAAAKTMVVAWDSVPIERNLASKDAAAALDDYVLKHDLLQYNDKIILQGQADEAMLIKLQDARTNGSGMIKDSRIYVARIVDGQQVINEFIDGKVSDVNVAIQNIERGLIITEELAPETVAYLKTLPRKSVLIATNALPRVADVISTEQVSNLLVLAENITVDISTLPSAKVIKATVQAPDNTAVPQLTPGTTDVQPQGQTPMLPAMPIIPPVLQLGKKGNESDISSPGTDYIALANLNRGPPEIVDVVKATASDTAMLTDPELQGGLQKALDLSRKLISEGLLSFSDEEREIII
ncbi:MAG: hypothetical protein KC618_02880, partial [Candidatus Omnitrophica bacterium]|nr:hypothetical protein [Candidatus Omnitrophota bacterium]